MLLAQAHIDANEFDSALELCKEIRSIVKEQEDIDWCEEQIKEIPELKEEYLLEQEEIKNREQALEQAKAKLKYAFSAILFLIVFFAIMFILNKYFL